MEGINSKKEGNTTMANLITYSYLLEGTPKQIKEAHSKLIKWSEEESDELVEGLPSILARELLGYSSDLDVEDYHYFNLRDESISLHSGEDFSAKFDIVSDLDLWELGDDLVAAFPELEISGDYCLDGIYYSSTYSPPGSNKSISYGDIIRFQFLETILTAEQQLNHNTLTLSVSCPHCSSNHVVDLSTIMDEPFNDRHSFISLNENNYRIDFITHCSNTECNRNFRVLQINEKTRYSHYSEYCPYFYDDALPLDHIKKYKDIPLINNQTPTPGYEPFYVEGTTIKKLYVKNNDDIIIPDGITCIGELAFEGCRMRKLSIPESVISIEKGALYNTTIEELVFPESITTLSDYVLGKCTVNKLILPNKLEFINSNCFANLNTSKLVIPSTVKSIGTNAFNKVKVEEIHFPNSRCILDGSLRIPKNVKVFAPRTSPIGIVTAKKGTGGILQ